MKNGVRGHTLEIDNITYNRLRRFSLKHRIIMNQWVSDLISARLDKEAKA